MKAISKSANCKSSPDVAFARIISEEGLIASWVGKIKIVEKDGSWPSLNSRMSFSTMGGLMFKAQVVDDQRPSKLVMKVETPSADSVITHEFASLPEGGTRYTKTVEPIPRSGTMGIAMILLKFMLNILMKKEVKRSAAFADAG